MDCSRVLKVIIFIVTVWWKRYQAWKEARLLLLAAMDIRYGKACMIRRGGKEYTISYLGSP
jgi:hypothetical protein